MVRSNYYRLSALLASIVCAVITPRAPAADAPRAPAAESTPPSPVAPGSVPPSAYVKPRITHEPYGEVRIVVALTTDDRGVMAMKLRNIANTLKGADAWHGQFTIKMVLYAKGVTVLKSPDEATREKLDMLRSRGVQIKVCDNSLAEQDIDFHTLYHVTDADLVPSGFAEVAYLQARQHYVADPVN